MSEYDNSASPKQDGLHEDIRAGTTSHQCGTPAKLHEGATSQDCGSQEETLDGATSKEYEPYDMITEVATPMQYGTREVPKGVLTKQSYIQDELPESATRRQVSGNELAWRWVRDLIEKPSKESIRQMKDDPGLISKRITMECSQTGCMCSNGFEKLQFDESTSKKETLHVLQAIIEHGRCPHLVSGTVSSRPDRNPLETTDTNSTELPIKQSDNEQVGSILAGITAVHVASRFGKVKIVEYITHALEERLRSPYIVECEEMSTSIHKYDPYYMSIIHQQDQVLGALRSHITLSMGWSAVYQTLLHNSIQQAVQNDSVRSLKILLSPPRCRTDYDMHCALLLAIKNRRMKCLKCLCKKGALLEISPYTVHSYTCSCRTRKQEVIKDMFLQEDNTIVEELLRHGDIRCRRMLHYLAVFYDNIVVTTSILENCKRMLLKGKTVYGPMKTTPVIIQAVLNNSTKMLAALLSCEYITAGVRHKHYTALDWARVLHFDECVSLLENAGETCDRDTTVKYPPLVELLSENVSSFYYGKSLLVNKLLKHGDVNAESVNGKTALHAALESSSYSVVRQLLLAGADPFRGRNSLTTFLSLRLLGEVLYANVDILQRRTGVSLVHHIIFSFPKLHCHLVFLLNHAHTITKSDLKLLKSLHDSNTISRDISDQINNFLQTPKTLVFRSRDVIRKHFGYKIHDLIKVCNLPTEIKSLLTLDRVLSHFLSRPFNDKNEI
ncbi:uncharacterized protein [Argopecten irradians]|uniref:uncharacterized protein n=1 Tax=Argopecten irradians TaxID=31199 RepID=UPI00371EF03D